MSNPSDIIASANSTTIPKWAQKPAQPKSDLPRIKTEEAKIDEVSRQFEAVILRNFLKDSLKPVFQTYLNKENSQNSIYRYHLVDSLAESMSEGQALGISNILQMQLKSTLSSKGSTETAK
jgi:Rod binding domain-containing protein